MGYFAEVIDGIVCRVLVVDDDAMNNLGFPDSEPIGQALLASLGFAGTWKQTSITASFRGVYAGGGGTYDATQDKFIAPVTSL